MMKDADKGRSSSRVVEDALYGDYGADRAASPTRDPSFLYRAHEYERQETGLHELERC